MVETGDEAVAGRACEDVGPSAERLRESLLERIGRIEDRNVLLVLDAVLSLAEPPFDAEVSLEAVLGVAEMVAGAQVLEELRGRRRRTDEVC